MEYLHCSMADHQDQQRPIIGICSDNNCKARQRILCSLCLEEYHNVCSKEGILNKEQLFDKLFKKYIDGGDPSPLDKLRTLRMQINQILDQVEQNFAIQQTTPITIISEMIRGFYQQQLTQDLWYQSYQFLNSELVSPEVQRQSKCLQALDKIKQVLEEFSVASGELQIYKNQNQLSQLFKKNKIQVDFTIGSIDGSPCGQYYACAADRGVIIIDVIQQKQIAQSPILHTKNVVEVRYSWNGKMIASCSHDHTIIIWNAKTLNQMKILKGHENSVWACFFSPDDLHLISGSFDKTIRIWNCETQEQACEKIELDYRVYSVYYSPNGKQILATGESKDIVIWDSKTRKILFKMIGHDGDVYAARYSVDGKLIITGDTNNCIKTWNALSGQQIGSYEIGNGEYISSLGFHPDCTFIVSGVGDETVRLWNFLTKKEECILHTHERRVETSRFSKDGKFILSGCQDGTMCIIMILQ